MHWQGGGLKLPNIAFSERLDDFDTLRLTQYGKYPRLSEDKVSAGKIDFEIDLDRGMVEVLRFGVRSSWRNYTYGRQVFQYGPGSGYVHDVDMPITASTGDVVCWGGDYSHFPCFISFDAEAILRQASARDGCCSATRRRSTTARRTSSVRTDARCLGRRRPSPAGG